MFHALKLCIENMFDTQIYKKMQNSCDIHSFINSYFIRQANYSCVKHVFNAWYSCMKCMNLWMNKLYTIFIINSLHVKFVVPSVCSVFLSTTCCTPLDAPPSSFMNTIVNPKVKTTEGEVVGVRSLAHCTSGVEGRAGVLGWD